MATEIATEHTLHRIEQHLDQLVYMLNDAWDPDAHVLRIVVVTGGGLLPTLPPFIPHPFPSPELGER